MLTITMIYAIECTQPHYLAHKYVDTTMPSSRFAEIQTGRRFSCWPAVEYTRQNLSLPKFSLNIHIILNNRIPESQIQSTQRTYTLTIANNRLQSAQQIEGNVPFAVPQKLKCLVRGSGRPPHARHCSRQSSNAYRPLLYLPYTPNGWLTLR